MIKTIIFDYAGVITPTKNNYLFAKKYHKRFGLTAEELMSLTYDNWRPALVSKSAEKRFWKELSRELDINPDLLLDLITETFPINSQIIKIIDKLKKRYKTILLSNQVESWLEKVIEENNLRSRFDYLINSYKFRTTKPGEIFF